MHLLLLAGPTGAQQLTNAGQALYVSSGATLFVGGSYAQSGAATLTTPGTVQLTGGLTAAVRTTLDLSTGRLEVGGHLQSGGLASSATGTLRLNGAAAQTLDTGGGTVGQLVLDKPAAAPRVDLPTILTVLGGVTLTGGLLRTAVGSALILSDGAALTGEASGNYVQGNLRATRAAVSGSAPVAFPNSLTVNPNGNNLGTVTVTRTAGLQTAGLSYGQDGTGANMGIDRIWRVVPARPRPTRWAWPRPGGPTTTTASARPRPLGSGGPMRRPAPGSRRARPLRPARGPSPPAPRRSATSQ